MNGMICNFSRINQLRQCFRLECLLLCAVRGKQNLRCHFPALPLNQISAQHNIFHLPGCDIQGLIKILILQNFIILLFCRSISIIFFPDQSIRCHRLWQTQQHIVLWLKALIHFLQCCFQRCFHFRFPHGFHGNPRDKNNQQKTEQTAACKYH